MILVCLVLFAQINVEADVVADVSYLYSASNLFYINPGFVNPGVSTGVIGMAVNPAAMASAQGHEAMVVFAPTMRTRTLTEFNIPFSSETPFLDTVKLPTDLGIKQAGGVDFIGAVFALGSWRVGCGYQGGDYLGIEFEALSTPGVDYGLNFDYVFTHHDIAEIPIGDSIPVTISFQGGGDLALTAEGEGWYRTHTFCIALSRTVLGMDMGIGWQIMPVEVQGQFSALFDGVLEGGGNALVESFQDWIVNAQFGLEIDADSAADAHGAADLKFALSTFYWGIRKEWRYFSMGLCGDFSFPAFIEGEWELGAGLPTALPVIRIDDDNLVVDTVNKTVTGNATIVVYDFVKDDTLYNEIINSMFMGTVGFAGGCAARIWRFEPGLFAGVNLSSDASYIKVRAGVHLGFNTFVPLHVGAMLHFQYFNISEIPISALPVISFGGGTHFSLGHFDIFGSVGGNTTQGAGSLIIPGIVGGEPKFSLQLSVGGGLRCRF
jgi:hypothetical protein